MPQFIRKFFTKKTIFSFIIAFIIFYFFFSKTDISKIVKTIANANIIYILIALLAFYIMLILKSLRWKIYLSNIGFKDKLLSITEIYFIAQFINTLLPARVGDFYRAYLMKKNFGVAKSRVLGTIFMERLLDITFMAILLSISVVGVYGKYVSQVMRQVGLILFLLVAILLLIFFIVKKQRRLFLRLLPKKLRYIAKNFEFAASTSLNLKTLPWIFLITAIIWSLECAILYLVSMSIGLKLQIFLVLFVVLLANALMIIPITPSGLGFVEAGVSGVLILAGIDKNIAISIALLSSIVNYWNQLGFGFLTYIISKKS